jgi:hypothetical protein
VSVVTSLITWALDHLFRRHERRLDVRLRVHRAFITNHPRQPECYFVNVFNASPERAVTVTHVWFATEPSVQVLTKTLPTRIEPGAQWETFVPVENVPAGDDIAYRARAQLADGTVVESIPRTDVPPAGFVPG